MNETSDYYLERKRKVRIATLFHVLFGAFVVIAWQHIPDAEGLPPAVSTHVSIPAALFTIADTVCAKNGGRKDVIIHKKDDTFTFLCEDGMSLRSAIVRVKKEKQT